MRRVVFLVVAPLLALVALSLPAVPASACSCAPVDPVAGLNTFPAAFVGTFVEKADVGDFEALYTFSVQEWVKGDHGGVITVRAPQDGGGCGYEFMPGQRMASFLSIEHGELTGGLCNTVDPDVLLRAAQPLVFDGTGPPRLLIVGPFTQGTHAVLDGDGGLLTAFGVPSTGHAHGFRDVPGSFHPCPGGRLLVERWGRQLVVRDLHTLEAVSAVNLEDFAGDIGVGDVDCRDRAASSIWMVGSEWSGDRSESRIYEAAPEPAPLLSLGEESGLIDIGPTVIVHHRRAETGEEVWLVRDDGTEMRLHRIERDEADYAGIVSAGERPGGGVVAVLDVRFPAGNATPTSTLVLYDTDGGELVRRSIGAEAGWMTWLDDDRILLWTYGEIETTPVGVVDAATLEPISTLAGWQSGYVVADGDVLYGLQQGHLMRADLRTGMIEELNVLNVPSFGPLALLPTDAAYPGAPEAVTTTTTTEAPAVGSGDGAPTALPPVGGPTAAPPWLAAALAVSAVGAPSHPRRRRRSAPVTTIHPAIRAARSISDRRNAASTAAICSSVTPSIL